MIYKPKCPSCKSEDIGLVRRLEENLIFEACIDSDGNKYVVEKEVVSRGEIDDGKGIINCFDCGEEFTFKEFLGLFEAKD
jgi:hypothetical protein